VLGLLSKEDLLKGKTIGVDATTLEANAALRSIVRRDDFRSYNEFLTGLAKASGIPTPTRDDLARIDRKRKKKGSNEDWVNPNGPDAQITKMKDGSTHIGHKQEHAVDMDSGAAVTLHGGAEGDTSTIAKTLDAADENWTKAREAGDKSKTREGVEEAVADKGYHSKRVMVDLALAGRRSYISEPARPRQQWDGEEAARDAVYANRRRKKSARGQRLMKKRGGLIERSSAHTLETGGMRRTHLRFHHNIAKRMLIHVADFNLGLLMRKRFGVGTPFGLQGRLAAVIPALSHRTAGSVACAIDPARASLAVRDTVRLRFPVHFFGMEVTRSSRSAFRPSRRVRCVSRSRNGHVVQAFIGPGRHQPLICAFPSAAPAGIAGMRSCVCAAADLFAASRHREISDSLGAHRVRPRERAHA
jgi:hypothetical protein